MAELEDKLNAILGNPEAMGQIMSLAQSLTGGAGGGAEPPPPPPSPAGGGDLAALLGQADPRMLRVGMEVLQAYQSGEDKSIALLAALRPFLKPEHQDRIDRALRWTRMARVIRAALNALGKEGEGDV